MPTVSFQLLLLSLAINMIIGRDYHKRSTEGVLRLSRICRPLMVRLDQYDSVTLTSDVKPILNTVIPGNLTCTAHYMTGNSDQGICIKRNYLSFKSPNSGVQLKIFTSRFGPDEAFNSFHDGRRFTEWCTRESLVSIELSSTHDFNDQNADYNFDFLLTNVSKEGIDKHYRMDSFKECNLSHVLKSGEAVKISPQEYPAHYDLPASCLLTFSTSSNEEFEEVCLRMVIPGTTENCLSSLVVSGFNSRFWPESEVLFVSSNLRSYVQSIQLPGTSQEHSDCTGATSLVPLSLGWANETIISGCCVQEIKYRTVSRDEYTLVPFLSAIILSCNNTHSKLREETEMCSGSKTLTLNLTRTSRTITGLRFAAVVEVKRHPYWTVISEENSELRVLEFVKGVTYFVAIIDSLAGIVAAILTSMFRRPRSFWKKWAENVKVPDKCEAIHYEDAYPGMSSSKADEMMDVKSY